MTPGAIFLFFLSNSTSSIIIGLFSGVVCRKKVGKMHMDDEPSGAIEMSRTGHMALPTADTAEEWEPRDNLEWVDTHIKRQNQCFWLTVVLLVVVAATYTIGGMSLANGDALEGEKYSAESGILADGFAGDKEQDLYEEQLDGKKDPKEWWKTHDRENPFGNPNAREHGNDVLSQMRANSTTPHKPIPGKPGRPQGGFPGQNGGMNGFNPGNRPNKPNNGRPGSNNHLRPGQGNSNQPSASQAPKSLDVPQPADGSDHLQPGQPNTNAPSASEVPKSLDVQQSVDVCDHSAYADWLSATVTLADGVKYEVVQRMAHDNQAFLQGLTYADGTLWESNGLYGKSSVRILDPDTGKVLKSVQIPQEVFGEGMTYWDGKLYQITWKAQRGFIYNSTTLDLIREFTFQTTRNEGWGITWDPCGQEFVVTDGSANLHFWDKDTLTEKRRVPVTRIDGRDARNLNEIEWFRGKILANVWYEDVLLVIDPVTGAVDKEYDFSTIFPRQERMTLKSDVFNGISVSGDPDLLYVSGKQWDRMFKVRLLV